MSLTRYIFRHGAVLASARAVTGLGRFAYAFLLAQWLGAEDYGQLYYALAWYVTFVPLACFGVNVLLVRDASRTEPSFPGYTISDSLCAQVATAAIAVCLSLVLAATSEPDAVLRSLLLLTSCAIAARALSLWTNALLTATGRTSTVFLVESGCRLLELSTGVWLASRGADVTTLVQWHTASWFAQAIVGLWTLRGTGYSIGLRWHGAAIVRLMRSGLPFVIGTLTLGWLFQGPLVLFRHTGTTLADLGALTLAVQILFLFSALVHDFGQAALAALSGRCSDGTDASSARRYARQALKAGVVFGTAYTILALVALPSLLLSLFGPDYAETARVLPMIGLVMTPWFWVQSLSSLCIARGRYGIVLLGNVAGAALFTLLAMSPVGHSLDGVLLAVGAGTLVASSGALYEVRSEWGCLREVVPSCAAALSITLIMLQTGTLLPLLAGTALMYPALRRTL